MRLRFLETIVQLHMEWQHVPLHIHNMCRSTFTTHAAPHSLKCASLLFQEGILPLCQTNRCQRWVHRKHAAIGNGIQYLDSVFIVFCFLMHLEMTSNYQD